MNFNYKEKISFTKEEENIIFNMIELLNNISNYCEEGGDLYNSAIKIRDSIEEFLCDYHEREE